MPGLKDRRKRAAFWLQYSNWNLRNLGLKVAFSERELFSKALNDLNGLSPKHFSCNLISSTPIMCKFMEKSHLSGENLARASTGVKKLLGNSVKGVLREGNFENLYMRIDVESFVIKLSG
jgi:hypothetical protein